SVEIMRDGTGQLANGFHLLRLAELFFQSFLRGDIPEKAQQDGGLPAQLDERTGLLQRDNLAIGERKPALDLFLDYALFKALPVLLEDRLRIIGISVNYRERFAFQLFAGDAEQFAEGIIDGDDVALLVGEAHAIDGVFPNGMEKHFRTAQGCLGFLALADI